MPLIIPGMTVVISTFKNCSTTGTICVVTNPTNSPAAATTFWKTPAKVSNTATPFSPKISCILSLAAPRFPSEKTPLIVSPTLVTTATILSNISSPFSPKIFPTASRTLSKFFRNSCTAVITAVTTPTTGKIFPAIPPNGPRSVEPIFPNGPNAFFMMFPTGAMNDPIFPKLEATTLPIDPSGERATMPPIPDSAFPSMPPIPLNGFVMNPTTFEPMLESPIAFILKSSRTLCASFIPLAMFRNPSFAVSPAILIPASAAATFRTV